MATTLLKIVQFLFVLASHHVYRDLIYLDEQILTIIDVSSILGGFKGINLSILDPYFIKRHLNYTVGALIVYNCENSFIFYKDSISENLT
jgi:hypothetical protein